MKDVAKAYRAGFVRRYHQNVELGWRGQTDAAHTWGVVTLLLMFHPQPTVDLIGAAQFHDVGELDTGDISGPFKRANPEFAAAHAKIETEARVAITDGWFEYANQKDKEWIVFCDQLEALAFCITVAPALAESRSWRRQSEGLVQIATDLGVRDEVLALLTGLKFAGRE